MKTKRPRLWTVADFARHVWCDESRAARSRAKRLLCRLDAKHGGKLLIPSLNGRNRRWRFLPATLRRLEPDYFAPVEDIEERLAMVEEENAELRRHQKMIATQVGYLTRTVERMRAQTRATSRAAS